MTGCGLIFSDQNPLGICQDYCVLLMLRVFFLNYVLTVCILLHFKYWLFLACLLELEWLRFLIAKTIIIINLYIHMI